MVGKMGEGDFAKKRNYVGLLACYWICQTWSLPSFRSFCRAMFVNSLCRIGQYEPDA